MCLDELFLYFGLVNGFSDQWVVRLMGFRTNGPSDLMSFWDQ